ncbi:hypothetical protein A6F68_00049 [Tsuneonella dongtanensis]|uniref:DUF4331 domain-containing protein n=2 Tax=Tsuneonella dongtanensis TaxID=692370 RepID=A0A1B2A948_9SPHN|nr:hypothetical protein A6F68_00049 [Tsuneonella dongtanensis]
MARLRNLARMAGSTAVAAAAVLVLTGAPNRAADHLDPPTRTDPSVDPTVDLPGDIADVFAWHGPGTVRLAVTFGGPNNPNAPAFYDRDVLYKLFISTAPPDDTPEITIRVQFGQGTRPNEHGVRFQGIPGVTGTIEGPVETTLEKDGVRARAGLHDDPFFFDSRGLRESRTTGQIRFNNTRDFFAAQNDTAFVIEVPRERLGNGTIKLWSTTQRFGGQL